MKRLMNGLLFAVPLPDGRFLAGRVMLDIAGNIKRRLFQSGSPLGNMFSRTVLVEMYSVPSLRPEYEPSPVLVPGTLVGPEEIGKGWPILGEVLADPRAVGFPEGVTGLFTDGQHGTGFYCGEMKIPVPLTVEQCGEINVRGGFSWASNFPSFCEVALGIPNGQKYAALEYNDLRFSKHRARVYEHLPFPMEMSYYEKQKMMGLHLERLYE